MSSEQKSQVEKQRREFRVILGVDAAWTTTQPSGVALVVETSRGWRLIAVADSYQRFHGQADGTEQEPRPFGTPPDAAALLRSAAKLSGKSVDLVAIDMPMAHSPITGRRAADDAVSKEYGGRKCATHSPSATRPGRVSDLLKRKFETQGFPLCTETCQTPALIEVYPHPALLELAAATERLPYKAAKIRNYWPDLDRSERIGLLLAQWENIIALLDKEIAGTRSALPPLVHSAKAFERKAYEDKLDAIVCAWVGICALEGRVRALGDKDSAIWIPIAQGWHGAR